MSDYFELDEKKLAELRKLRSQKQAQAAVTGDIVEEQELLEEDEG